MAISAATLTTVAVFLPIAYVEGVAGELFAPQAWTVTFSLLASLAVSLTVLPMLAVRAVREGRCQQHTGDADPHSEQPVPLHGRTSLRQHMTRVLQKASCMKTTSHLTIWL